MKALFITLAVFGAFAAPAQRRHTADTLSRKTIDSVTVRAYLVSHQTSYLPETGEDAIFAGKRTARISPDAVQANLAGNVARMAFAKIPGLNIWDMDGAGTQLNVGGRGTDTHRSIETNMRQNGYMFNSDPFGYPEAHYTAPLQGVDHIEYIRGSAALQYGPQFNGMMNFVMKDGDSTRPLAIESEQTAGSYNFFNSFNSVGGSSGKLTYYAYYDYRHGDDWRPNARFDYHAYYASLRYQFNDKLSLTAQFSRMNYVQKIAGGLTDAQFNSNAQQNTRNRNYFQPEINIPALLLKWQIDQNTQLNVTASALLGQRNSVQFIANPNVPDTFNTSLGSFNPRQVDRDSYNGFTTEARLMHRYRLGNLQQALSAGLRYSTQTTLRRQKGPGTTGDDFNLALTAPYGIDLDLHTENLAAFAENVFHLTRRLSFTPGVRLEYIRTDMSGAIINASVPVSYGATKVFPLFGAGIQYDLSNMLELYANISQEYRPYLYANVTPADRVDQIDPNLKDVRGHDVDLGFRGMVRDILRFDAGLFYVFYGNRVGLLNQTNSAGTPYLYTTNIGNAESKGFESFWEISLAGILGTNHAQDIRLFQSLSYTDAKYLTAAVSTGAGGTVKSVSGNRIEGTPDWISRSGITFVSHGLSATLQHSYVGRSFNDAFNTVFSPIGSVGYVPDYQLLDLVAAWQFTPRYRLSGGVNNLTDKRYFTRRITMYPGPGILPADGRTFYLSLNVRL